jgi:hypothetical protein
MFQGQNNTNRLLLFNAIVIDKKVAFGEQITTYFALLGYMPLVVVVVFPSIVICSLSGSILVIGDDLENPNFALCQWEVY